MLEKLSEPIEVLVKFSTPDSTKPGHLKNVVRPTFFKWREKTYQVEKINLVHREKRGDDKIYYFSVSDSVNYFKLAFSTADMGWRIEELFFEG